MNEIVPFDFDATSIRVQVIDGQPWFVASDICDALGIENHRHAVGRLLADERGSLIVHTLGGAQTVGAVNESGMWKLVLRSRKPAADRLTTWLTSEVLPSLRKTGSYGAPAAALDFDDPATLQRLLLNHTGRTLAADERIAILEPKAAALDRFAHAEGALTPTAAAKTLGVRPGRLFDWLEHHRWLYRGADGLLGRQNKIDQGLLEHKPLTLDRGRRTPKVVTQALITTKGLALLAELRAGL